MFLRDIMDINDKGDMREFLKTNSSGNVPLPIAAARTLPLQD
jgi:hypothetical protein